MRSIAIAACQAETRYSLQSPCKTPKYKSLHRVNCKEQRSHDRYPHTGYSREWSKKMGEAREWNRHKNKLTVRKTVYLMVYFSIAYIILTLYCAYWVSRGALNIMLFVYVPAEDSRWKFGHYNGTLDIMLFVRLTYSGVCFILLLHLDVLMYENILAVCGYRARDLHSLQFTLNSTFVFRMQRLCSN